MLSGDVDMAKRCSEAKRERVKKVYSTWFIKPIEGPLGWAVGMRNRLRGGTPYDHVLAVFRYQWEAKAWFIEKSRAMKAAANRAQG